MKFRKKPVVIEAMQNPPVELPWTGAFMKFLDESGRVIKADPNDKGVLIIHTLEGEMRANPMDWIIKGVNGEYYPCKPDIFEKTYEVAE